MSECESGHRNAIKAIFSVRPCICCKSESVFGQDGDNTHVLSWSRVAHAPFPKFLRSNNTIHLGSPSTFTLRPLAHCCVRRSSDKKTRIKMPPDLNIHKMEFGKKLFYPPRSSINPLGQLLRRFCFGAYMHLLYTRNFCGEKSVRLGGVVI